MRCKRPTLFANPFRVGAAGGNLHTASALRPFIDGRRLCGNGSVNSGLCWGQAPPSMSEVAASVEGPRCDGAPASDMLLRWVSSCTYWSAGHYRPRAENYIILQNVWIHWWNPSSGTQALEEKVFRKPLEEICSIPYWIFQQRDPRQIENAPKTNPRRKMALISDVPWLISNWANAGTPDSSPDFSNLVWTSHGRIQWLGGKGTYLEHYENRKSGVIVALQ